jgi:hypothetical protein
MTSPGWTPAGALIDAWVVPEVIDVCDAARKAMGEAAVPVGLGLGLELGLELGLGLGLGLELGLELGLGLGLAEPPPPGACRR